jgi:hypothetical protein
MYRKSINTEHPSFLLCSSIICIIGTRKNLSSAYDEKKEKAIIYKLSAFLLAPLFPAFSIVSIQLYCHLRAIPMHIRFSFFPFPQKMSFNLIDALYIVLLLISYVETNPGYYLETPTSYNTIILAETKLSCQLLVL